MTRVHDLLRSTAAWWRRAWSDHGDGTNHRWVEDGPGGYIIKCAACGKVEFPMERL